jgi:hypothetical protein
MFAAPPELCAMWYVFVFKSSSYAKPIPLITTHFRGYKHQKEKTKKTPRAAIIVTWMIT